MAMKRGVFYSIISLLILSIMLMTFRPQSEQTLSDKLMAEDSRIKIADSLIKTINEAFVSRMLIVSSYRALNALALYAGAGDTILPSELQDTFERVMLTGNITVNSKIDDWIPEKVMENHSLFESLDMFEHATWDAQSVIVQFNHSSASAQIYQNNESGAGNVIVNLSMNYKVNAGVAKWNVSHNWSIKVPISGLYDPLWLNYKNLKIPIHFADYDIDYHRNWSSLWHFIDVVDFRKQSYGPSYLMRLTDDLGESKCCGIESAVNPYLLNFSVNYNRTYIDFCFYSVGRCAPYGENKTLYELKNITSHIPFTKFYGFKLDARHYVETGSYGGNGTTGASPTGFPSVTLVQCEINSSWVSCNLAQWHKNITATRAKCEHSDGYDKVHRVGFKLVNDYDNNTFFDVSNSTRQADGIWYYDNPDTLINDSDWWSLTVECEDENSLKDVRVERWYVPWGWFNITWWYDENGTLKANVTCVGGECGQLNISLGSESSVRDNFDDSTLIETLSNLILTSGRIELAGNGTGGWQKGGLLVSKSMLLGINASSILSFNASVPSLPSETSMGLQFSNDTLTWVNSTGGSSWNSLQQGTNNITLESLGWSGDSLYYRVAFNSSAVATPNLDWVKLSFTIG